MTFQARAAARLEMKSAYRSFTLRIRIQREGGESLPSLHPDGFIGLLAAIRTSRGLRSDPHSDLLLSPTRLLRAQARHARPSLLTIRQTKARYTPDSFLS